MEELELRELFKKNADAWEVNDEEVTMTEDVFIKLMYDIGTLQNTSSNSDYAKCSHKYVDAQGVGGGYIFKYCNICGKTKHFA